MSKAQWPRASSTSFFHGTEETCEAIMRAPDVSTQSLGVALIALKERLFKRWKEFVAKDPKRDPGLASKQNWRWEAGRFYYKKEDREKRGISKELEVSFERETAIMINEVWKSDKWANQVPVASGFVSSRGDRKAALDFAHYDAETKTVTMFELKWASNGPRYAAFELIRYALMLTLAHEQGPKNINMIHGNWSEVKKVKLAVVAPVEFYPATETQSLIQFQNMLSAELKKTKLFAPLGFTDFTFRWFPKEKADRNWENEAELRRYFLDDYGLLKIV